MGRLRTILQKYIPEKQFFDTLEFFKDQKINYLYFIKSKILPLEFVNDNLEGGKRYDLELKINNQKYKVHIDEYSDTDDDNKKIINFIKLGAILNKDDEYKEDDHCGVLILDKINENSTIQSINNYTECLKCLEGVKPFKVGDILTQIMIIMSMRNNMKKISLTDNSYLMCANSKISLIHLRTMTKGIPYYAKYGFIPTYENEYKIFEENKKIFKKKPTLTKEELINLFFFHKFDDHKDKKIIKYISNTLIPRLKKNNLVSEFIDKIIDDKNEEGCTILFHIYMKIYDKIGYDIYKDRYFKLDLTKNKLIKDNKKK